MDNIAARIQVTETFLALQTEINNLKNLIIDHDRDLPIWLQEPDNLREQAFNFINQLEYLNNQEPREILIQPGVIAASAETIEQVTKINTAKNNFKQAMLELKKSKINHLKDPRLNQKFEQIIIRSTNISHTLNKLGLARLHLKQCYRTLPILPARPIKISYTWANTRAITKITVKQAFDLLSKHKPSNKIQIQLEKLATLSINTPLAIIQELAPHLRVNLLFSDNIKPNRMMLKGPVPLFYYSPNKFINLPEIIPPKAKQARDPNRLKRNDTKIDPEVFLPTLRAHKYF